MALTKLSKSTDVINVKDIPWANVWSKTNKDDDIPKVIWKVIVYDSGLMVCCKEYKGYLKEETQEHIDLLEALEVFMHSKEEEFLLLVGIKNGKQIEIFVEDEYKCHRWVKTENNYVQVLKGTEEKKSTERTNPLLAGRGVRSTPQDDAEFRAAMNGTRKQKPPL